MRSDEWCKNTGISSFHNDGGPLVEVRYKSVQETLNARGSRYGDFTTNAALTQALKDVMWAADGWVKLTPVQRQGLEVIMDKVARILNGDPNYADNWHDIQGYAKLVEERLPKERP